VGEKTQAARKLYTAHPRLWRDFRYVYPVVSRRSRGLSIGINLNPDKVCSFDCVYCQVDRTTMPGPMPVDFERLSCELRTLLTQRDAIFADEPWKDVPPALRRLRDIAFSGDGEPTASPAFPAAAGLAAELREELALHDAKIVVLTNGLNLRRPSVIQTLAFLDGHNGEVWIKLDAGTQAYFEQVNRVHVKLDQIVDSIRVTARVRPVVLQSMFMCLHGQPPPGTEIDAYLGRLRSIVDGGGAVKLVQAYTVARQTAEPYVSALSRDQLESIAARIRALGIAAEAFV